MSQTDLLEQLPSFQLKGGMLPLTTLELLSAQPALLARQLEETLAADREFFLDAPIVLALDKLSGRLSPAQLDEIVLSLQQLGLHLVGVRTGNEQEIAAVRAKQLPVLPLQGNKSPSKQIATEPSQPTTVSRQPSMLVQQPVRSGQQVYAKDSELIVIAAVSSGAEALADGNIHIYGALRGKAAAGINGDQQARIFCQQLEADMISIAGHYKIAEELRKLPAWGQPCHIFLQDQQLHIQQL